MIDRNKLLKHMNNEVIDEVAVSVCMTTYNHEKYIAEAIESVLNQKTNFKFELLIGEDCSTDNTKSIVKKYEKENPDIIKAIYHSKNVGIHENEKSIFRLAKGKYIAFLEGDDYWCNTNKIQIQFDFLEEHSDYIAYAHDNMILENGKLRNDNYIEKKDYTYIDALKNRYLAHTSSFFLRNYFKYLEKEDFDNYFNLKVYSHGKLVITTGLIGKWYRPNEPEIMSVHRYYDSPSGKYYKNVNNPGKEFIRKMQLKSFVESEFPGEKMKIDDYINKQVYSAFFLALPISKKRDTHEFKLICSSGYYSFLKIFFAISSVYVKKLIGFSKNNDPYGL